MTFALIKQSIRPLLFLGLAMILLSSCQTKQEADILGSIEAESKQAEPVKIKMSPVELMTLEELKTEDKKKKATIFLNNTKKIDSAMFKIYGETSNNCSKIVVNAYDIFKKSYDVYTLESYSYGDTTFDYDISEAWNNLQDGENTYIFRAYCDEEQVEEASTSITYYGSYDASELEDQLKAVQEELENIKALKDKLEVLPQEDAPLEINIDKPSKNNNPNEPVSQGDWIGE